MNEEFVTNAQYDTKKTKLPTVLNEPARRSNDDGSVVSRRKTIAKYIELGRKGFGRLIQDISEAVLRNDVEYLAQFDFVRTSDPVVQCGDAVEPKPRA
jgi:hypothetical protein